MRKPETILVTPCWAPDAERCRLMLDSTRRFAQGFTKHVLIVDALDEKQFRAMAGNDVELVLKEDLLPTWLHQSNLSRRWWWSTRWWPMRGWIVQQATKMAIATRFDADAFCFIDADTLLIRPLLASELWQGDRVRFYRDVRKPHFYRSRRYRNWYRFAAEQLDLGDPERLDGAYIAQLNVMHRKHLLNLCAHIEKQSGRPWIETLIRCQDFSEYILYGTYIDYCSDQSGHYSTSTPLCHSSWFYDLDDEAGMAAFTSELSSQHVAIHVQSNLHIDATNLKAILARFET